MPRFTHPDTFDPQPGEHWDGVPFELYHEPSRYLHASGLKAFRRSPLHAASESVYGEETPARFGGSFLHALVLEPGEVDGRYIDLGDCSKAVKGNTARVRAAEEEGRLSGRSVIRDQGLEADLTTLGCRAIAASVRSQAAWGFVAGEKPIVERSWYFEYTWLSPRTGELRSAPCCIRTDAFRFAKRNGRWRARVADLKFTRDASADSFSRDVDTFGYALSCALYADGVSTILGGIPVDSWLVAVEKRARAYRGKVVHPIAYWLMDQEQLNAGRLELESALEEWWEAKESGVDHGYNRGITAPLPLSFGARKRTRELEQKRRELEAARNAKGGTPDE